MKQILGIGLLGLSACVVSTGAPTAVTHRAAPAPASTSTTAEPTLAVAGGRAYRTQPATLEELAVGDTVIYYYGRGRPHSESEAYGTWRIERSTRSTSRTARSSSARRARWTCRPIWSA